MADLSQIQYGSTTYDIKAKKLEGFTSTASQSWGNQTGTFVHGENAASGGSWAFRKDNPASGQVSFILDGDVYIKEGGVKVGDAIKSITRSGTTFTYTTLWGNTGTFTQQDTDTNNMVEQQNYTSSYDARLLLSWNQNDNTETAKTTKNTQFRANPGTGRLRSTYFNVADHVDMKYNTTTQALDFIFS